jgi:hypothetical protein
MLLNSLKHDSLLKIGIFFEVGTEFSMCLHRKAKSINAIREITDIYSGILVKSCAYSFVFQNLKASGTYNYCCALNGLNLKMLQT